MRITHVHVSHACLLRLEHGFVALHLISEILDAAKQYSFSVLQPLVVPPTDVLNRFVDLLDALPKVLYVVVHALRCLVSSVADLSRGVRYYAHFAQLRLEVPFKHLLLVCLEDRLFASKCTNIWMRTFASSTWFDRDRAF